jgi:hypothetical protein
MVKNGTANEGAEMSEMQKNTVTAAINECARYIIKESQRNPALRPADVQSRLEWTVLHMKKLMDMVA